MNHNESKDVQFHKSATSRFDPGRLRVTRMTCIGEKPSSVSFSDVLDADGSVRRSG